MKDELPKRTYDFSWCRWVAMFLPDTALLIRKLAGALRPQGIAMFHEYAQYSTWRFCPALPLQEEFVRRALESWRATGAEPDIARDLSSLLIANGFQVRSVLPRLFCVGPDDPIWQWLATFIDSGLDRLQMLDLADGEFAAELRRELAKREREPASLVISPLILEIIAEKLV